MAGALVVLAAVFAWCGTPTRADKAPLPDVDSVLTKANSKAHDFAEQARAMQQRLLLQQNKSRAALAAQKEGFEHRLNVLSAQSKAIGAKNAELQASNTKLEQENAATMAECKGLENRNSELRETLQTIGGKVAAAQDFLLESLKITDDSEAKELEVLAPTTPKPTLDNFLAATRDDKISLLAIRSRRAEDPSEYVSMLSNSLAEISTAEADGAAELKAHFMAELETITARQASLNTTQAELNQTQAKLQEHRSSLLAAKAHLQDTNKQLDARLQSLRVFANKVGVSVAVSLGAKTTVDTTANVTANATANVTANATVNATSDAVTASLGNTSHDNATNLLAVSSSSLANFSVPFSSAMNKSPATLQATANITAATERRLARKAHARKVVAKIDSKVAATAATKDVTNVPAVANETVVVTKMESAREAKAVANASVFKANKTDANISHAVHANGTKSEANETTVSKVKVSKAKANKIKASKIKTVKKIGAKAPLATNASAALGQARNATASRPASPVASRASAAAPSKAKALRARSKPSASVAATNFAAKESSPISGWRSWFSNLR